MTVYGESFKNHFHLLEFRYGDPASQTIVRITDWTSDVTNSLAGGVFTSFPSVSLKGMKNSGSLVGSSVDVVVPETLPLALLVSAMEPHSPVFVTVWQVAARLEISSPGMVILFKGRLVQAVANESGKQGLVRMVFKDLKARLDIPLGRVCIPHCPFVFGDLDCKVDAVSLEESGTCSGIDGKTVSITGLSAQTGRYWHRGFIRRNGLQIMIRDWDNDVEPGLFYLAQAAPAEWTGQTIVVRPGCSKDPETCDDRWSNLENFGGIGYATPNRNPAFRSN